MLKLFSAVALSVIATAAIGSTTTTKQTVMAKSNPAATTVRHTTVTRTSHRRVATAQAGKAITFARAERIALNARPGLVVSHKMDRERSGPAYSFNIKSNGRRFEVDVNRANGRIVENRRV